MVESTNNVIYHIYLSGIETVSYLNINSTPAVTSKVVLPGWTLKEKSEFS